MPELSFFIGKGGVGKTTVSSAYASAIAARHPRKKVLLLSTDPAHSLQDVFEKKFSDAPQRISPVRSGQLYAWQINAEKHFHSFLQPHRGPILDLIESGTIFSRDEIEPLLNTTLPGMSEVSALIAISDLLRESDYDHIVVDTAPIGHTLRMFEMPLHFSRFLEFLDLAGNRDRWLSQRFSAVQEAGPTEKIIATWRQMVMSVAQALTTENADLFMVTSPEEFSLNEALRSSRALADSVPGLKINGIVLNRALAANKSCPRCSSRAAMTASSLQFIKKNFPGIKTFRGEEAGNPLLGFVSLRAFGDQMFFGKKAAHAAAPPKSRFPRLRKTAWPEAGVPLLFTLGKGGVGKTTVSASIGYHERLLDKKTPVIVCSTDPAPSLDDVFQTRVTGTMKPVLKDAKFLAMEIDSVGEFRKWSHPMQQKIDSAFSTSTRGGVQVDMSFDRQIFTSLIDIVPPGVDEIFAIFKILDLIGAKKKHSSVIIDMAPTGHAIELLRMPERMLIWSRLLLKSLAPHRTLPLAQDVAVQIATLGQRVRELAKMLQDPKLSCAFAVMLAEPMPDHETSRLFKALKGMEVGIGALFVNRIIMSEGKCVRCKRAKQWQAHTLSTLKKRYPGQTIYLLPDISREVAGAKQLQRFTRELWQLA